MGWLWLGLLIGLLVGGAAVALLVRAVGGAVGADARSVGRLVLDGLTPGRRREGVAAQRALARRLRRAGERTAAGKRVAAEVLTVHVSPEDHDSIGAALGIATAEQDLAEFYRDHASGARWIVVGEPEVHLVRDISLRPRQAYVRTATRSGAARPATVAPPAPPVPPAPDDAAVTDVLPRTVQDDSVTAVYPANLLLGDLIVVRGTDVRTVTAAEGMLRIGRGAHNDLVLDRPGVDRDHLVLEARGDAWWAVPGSGATTLDGRALDQPTAVTGEAVLELGRGTRIRLTVRPLM